MNVSDSSDLTDDLEIISYNAKKEIEAVCSWYKNWERDEREVTYNSHIYHIPHILINDTLMNDVHSYERRFFHEIKILEFTFMNEVSF